MEMIAQKKNLNVHLEMMELAQKEKNVVATSNASQEKRHVHFVIQTKTVPEISLLMKKWYVAHGPNLVLFQLLANVIIGIIALSYRKRKGIVVKEFVQLLLVSVTSLVVLNALELHVHAHV